MMELNQQREKNISSKALISEQDIKDEKKNELSFIEKALGDKLKTNIFGSNPQQKKNNYGILTEILPYSDRR